MKIVFSMITYFVLSFLLSPFLHFLFFHVSRPLFSFVEYIKIQRDYFISAAKEIDDVYVSVNPGANGDEAASVTSSHSAAASVSSQPQQSTPTQFVHTVSTKIGAFPVLGVPLAALTRHGVETLGLICKVLVVTGVSCNGIYSQSRRERVAELKAMLSRKECIVFEKEDAHDVAALLLAFFKELPEPLLTFSLCDDWIRCGDGIYLPLLLCFILFSMIYFVFYSLSR